MKKYILIFLLMASFGVKGQPKQPVTEADYNNTEVEMADKLREEGKIYVVVAILTTILVGFLAYTINIDRKVRKLEKEVDGRSDKIQR